MSVNHVIVLLEDADDSGDGVLVPIGGTYAFGVDGTFDGATVDLHMLGPDGTNYVAIADTGLDAEGWVAVDIPAGSTMKAVVTGGSSPYELYASLSLIK